MKTKSKKDFCPRFQSDCQHPLKRNDTGFIIMAYDEYHSETIEQILREGIKSIGYTPKLSTDFKTQGSADMFCTRVCKPIRESSICIADVTYDNTSVGFEWALSEKFEKPVIATLYLPKKTPLEPDEKKYKKILKKKGLIKYPPIRKDIPGDFQGLMVIKYKSKNELVSQLKSKFDLKEDE